MNDLAYFKSNSTAEAIAQVSNDDQSRFIGGGTNIIDLIKYNLFFPSSLVDINGLKKEIIIKTDDGILIDAFAKNADLAYHQTIEDQYPLLSRAILAGASPQIRNMATNGGNLLQRTRCYYFYDANTPCNKREPGSGCSALNGYNRNMAILGTTEHCIAVFPSDMCVALAALDASVHIAGPKGNRILQFADFHRLPGDTPHLDNNLQHGELIIGIELPNRGFNKYHSYLKLRDRNSYAFALVSVATGFEIELDVITEARIALGGVAHKPWRVTEAEEFLKGKSPNSANFALAADIVLEGAKGYGFNDFKIGLAKKAIIRNCMMALDPSSQLPGAQPSL